MDRILRKTEEAGPGGGTPWDDVSDDIARLRDVQLGTGFGISYLKSTFDLVDGRLRTAEHGRSSHAADGAEFGLMEGEFIRRMEVFSDDALGVVVGLVLHSNRRRFDFGEVDVSFRTPRQLDTKGWPLAAFFGHFDRDNLTGLGLQYFESTQTRVAVLNSTTWNVNNAIFAYLVPPGERISATVGEEFPAAERERFPQRFGSVDRGVVSSIRDVEAGTWQVVVTWDDVGARKYVVAAVGSLALRPLPPESARSNLIVYTEVDGKGTLSVTHLI